MTGIRGGVLQVSAPLRSVYCNLPALSVYSSFAMAPPSTRTADKLSETINAKLDKLMKEFGEFKTEFQQSNAAKDREIAELRDVVGKLTDRLSTMEDKVADTEAKARENNIILSGEDVPAAAPNENCTEAVRSLLQQKLNIIIPTVDISSSTRIGKGPGGKKNFLVKFKNFDCKMKVINACRTQKPRFYANDDLTPEKQTVLYALRQARRRFPDKVDGCSSTGGKIYAYMKSGATTATGGGSRRNRRVAVGNLTKLRNFCIDELGTDMEHFIANRHD